MFVVTAASVMIMFISMAMIAISSILSKKSFMDREKSSPFECGFDPKSSSRLPFSLQFFLIAVIFLIFDVEIALLIPLISVMKISKINLLISISFFFIIILLLGLFHEWNQGALEWAV
uniref:NADH-ubiquinone oxidoreductase chain 3 n=1 Tax=Prosopocoilus laterotarsus maedaorum TaxID=618908 RepID=A0A7H1DJK0_9SCAR|nr:NADH dehydrogenase subunit 3 [Prosopocoilus laterotarsus]QNS37142.1 NADH dehydrogenase subunit 3 [Prosopocoilus laterotarsus maedaorum]UTM10033.1 NADH dehydrogenase subunit 3 [Prosopocoilus laterotarsus]